MLRIFCVMRKGPFVIRGIGGRTMPIPVRPCGFLAGRVDFEPAVRIFEDLCGFVMGIFRLTGLKSAVFGPKRPFPDGSGPRAIRTTCFRIRKAASESARSTENPHGTVFTQPACIAGRRGPVLLHRLAVPGAQWNPRVPRQSFLNQFRTRCRNASEPVSDAPLAGFKTRPCRF